MAENKRMGCMIILLILILLIVFGGGGFLVYRQYNKTIAHIKEELAKIPEYDEEATKQKIAKDMNIKLPVDKPYMKKIEVERAIKKQLHNKSLEMYTTESLESKVKAVKDKYNNLPSIGTKIEIKLKKSDKVLSGKYNGIVEEDGVEYLDLNGKKYNLFDIEPEYYWMFNDLTALDILSAEVKKIRQAYTKNRKKYIYKNTKQVTEQIYSANGYILIDKVWKPVYDVFSTKLRKEKKKFKKARIKKINDVYTNNKLFGLIQLDAVQAGIESIDLKNLKDLKKELNFGEDKAQTEKPEESKKEK
jgi:hypothetical protein